MVTMHDVARRAGVSQSTVSLVLNDELKETRISEETRRRVRAAVIELGYRRNEIARSMVTGHNHILSVLTSMPDSEYEARIIAGILSAAEECEYHVKVVAPNEESGETAAVDRCMALRPAGLLAISPLQSTIEALHNEATRFGVPIAMIDTSFQMPWGIRVASNDHEGARMAIEHLITYGHHTIAFLGGPNASGPFRMREEGFRSAMQALGLPLREQFIAPNIPLDSSWDERARPLVRGWLRNPIGPTAILCANDSIAMRAIRAVTTMDHTVPDDISIVGYSDMSLAKFGNPPLTTIAQPLFDMGKAAARRLLERIQQDSRQSRDPGVPWVDTPYEEVLANRLIVRESAGVARRY